ncbi:hypothetical protein HAX54_025247, partial [Datura stramonium]|nr:hypothetical protein [Datura stramonium]
GDVHFLDAHPHKWQAWHCVHSAFVSQDALPHPVGCVELPHQLREVGVYGYREWTSIPRADLIVNIGEIIFEGLYLKLSFCMDEPLLLERTQSEFVQYAGPHQKNKYLDLCLSVIAGEDQRSASLSVGILDETGVLSAICALAVVIRRLDHRTWSKLLGALARVGASWIDIGVLLVIFQSLL